MPSTGRSATSVRPSPPSLYFIIFIIHLSVGGPLDDPYADPYWDEPLVCKAQKTPSRASEVVVLMASSPRKRFYVGDHIPVQLEVRNHTTKTISCMAMSLVLFTFGIVMGYKEKDKVPITTVIVFFIIMSSWLIVFSRRMG